MQPQGPPPPSQLAARVRCLQACVAQLAPALGFDLAPDLFESVLLHCQPEPGADVYPLDYLAGAGGALACGLLRARQRFATSLLLRRRAAFWGAGIEPRCAAWQHMCRRLCSQAALLLALDYFKVANCRPTGDGDGGLPGPALRMVDAYGTWMQVGGGASALHWVPLQGGLRRKKRLPHPTPTQTHTHTYIHTQVSK